MGISLRQAQRMGPKIEHEALACPFCGGPAEIEPWHGGKPTKVLISCSDHCEVAPSVTGETRRQALTVWNQRR